MNKQYVLIVEDDQDLATSIGEYLSLENFECDYDLTGRLAYNLTKHDYDVIILDLNLPYRDGLTICNKLRKNNVCIPIIMLTARETLENKLDGFAAGTDDYLIKPFEMQELVVRLQALTNRNRKQEEKLTVDDLIIDTKQRTIFRADKEIKLTPFCWKILVYLVRNSPRVISRQELEDFLWEDDNSLSTKSSLKVHIHKLRLSIDKPFVKPLIHTIPGVGITIRDSDEKADD